MPYTQANRLIALATPLGPDKLLLASLSGNESISRLFTFHLELLYERPRNSPNPLPADPIKFSDIVGQNVTISLRQADNTLRYFNGIVSRFANSGADVSFVRYEMEVVPWTWKLTRYADCKIFHNKTVGQIIEQVFKDRSLTDYKLSLNGSYNPLEYCVQYRETDFNFISRLMEQFGIFYFFQHQVDKHTMVIADNSNAHTPCPGQAKAGYNLVAGGLDEEDVINSWSIEQELRSGKYSHTDYNFKTPSAKLEASEPTVVKVGNNAGFEIFDYPGEYPTRADGDALAKLRMQEEEATCQVASGSSVCRAFATGYKFTLADHYQTPMNTDYVLTGIQYVATTHYGSGSGANESYTNQFTCIPATVPFRPARLTAKPFVQGPQTAIVIGKKDDKSAGNDDGGGDGEEIWVDDSGRVVVRFPWDRAGASSCRVRVSQDWAGQGWGAITIPRVGQEVLVSFLEGDPDRPIITGRVYNAEQTLPYPLPANQTRSTFKTRSSEGGGTDNYNELRFEDKTNQEQIFLRGEHDLDTRMKNDSREWVGNNRSLIIGKDQMEKVGGDLHSQIASNQNQKIGQTLSLQVGQNLYEKSGMNFAHEAGQVIHLKAGMTVVLEAGIELTLKASGNFIDIGPSGIAISGTMVMINSGGAAGSGCGSSPTDPKDPDEADDGSKGGKMK